MKTFLTSFPELYADWSAIGWSMLLGNVPKGPASELTANPSQASAEQKWENEGGGARPPKNSPARPALRGRARRKAPAKKRPARRKAKGARRR